MSTAKWHRDNGLPPPSQDPAMDGWKRALDCVAQGFFRLLYLAIGGYATCLLGDSLYAWHAPDADRGADNLLLDFMLGTLLLIALYGVLVGLAGKGVGARLIALTRRYSGRIPLAVVLPVGYLLAMLTIHGFFLFLHFLHG